MYLVRNVDTPTRWCHGTYNEDLGYYVKYQTEYDTATYYKNEFDSRFNDIDDFYKAKIDDIQVNYYISITTIKKYKPALDILLDSLPDEFKKRYILVYQNENVEDYDEEKYTVFEDGHIEVYIKHNLSDYGNWVGVNILLKNNIVPQNSWFLFIHDTCKFLSNTSVKLLRAVLNKYENTETEIVWLSATGQCNICLIRRNAIEYGAALYKKVEYMSKMETIKCEWDHGYKLSPKSFQVKQEYLNDDMNNTYLGKRFVYNNTNNRDVLLYKSIHMEKYFYGVGKEEDHPLSP